MKKLCLIIPLFLIPLSLFAEYGCLVPGHPELLTFQTNPPGGIFSNTPGEIYPSAGCQWIFNVSAPSNGCVGHGKGGIKGTYYQQCPIDDSLSIFFIFTTGIAVLQLRKIWHIADENNDYHSSL